MNTIKIKFEHTDTFSGEANYCWCKRGEIEVSDSISDLALVRKVKKQLDLSGIPCRKENYGDTIALYPSGSCTVVFIYW